MYKSKRILGIIPARGGSKGLPKKNVLLLLGKPLIVWTIEKALQNKCCDVVMVNTDDDEIAQIAKSSRAEVPFMRPPELAGDATPIFDVIAHTIAFYKSKNISFDYIALLEPTSPLRKENDIDNAIRELIDREREADSLVSVSEVHTEHPSIVQKIDAGYVKSYVVEQKKTFRRQDLDRAFFPYGVIYLSKTEKLLEHETFYQGKTIPYYLERWQNYEIDDLIDFVCVEAILQHKMR